jgi:hypothetical protein
MEATPHLTTTRISSAKAFVYAFAIGVLAPSLVLAQAAPPMTPPVSPEVPPAATPPTVPAVPPAAAPTAPPSDIVTPPPAADPNAPPAEAAPPPPPPPPLEPPPPSAPVEVPPDEPFTYPPPPPLEPPPAMLPQPSKIPAYILWGGAGVSLIVGTIYGVSTLSAKSDFDADPTYARGDSVHNRSIAADVGFGLGLVLGITGTVFYFLADKPPEAAPVASGMAPGKKVTAKFAASTGGGALNLSF